PGNPDGIYLQLSAQIDHDPLRVHRVVFAGEWLRQVGIALPIAREVAVGEPRPAVAIALAETAVWEGVSPGMADHRIGGFGAPGKISFLLFRVAPDAFGIPVPGLVVQFRVLAVGHSLPSRVENLLEDGIDQHAVGASRLQPVDTRAQGAEG